MGKPLSRPDCLRQNTVCLGKGEEDDGYIEDCYVPQRSIYDTMRINEQIDQGTLSQPSKSTIDKTGEGSTLSSNGTLNTANVFETRPQESKKLDERVIYDALKLSSDHKVAPVPAKRRPHTERKDNLNRRSWKSFIPPNFPEVTEKMDVSSSDSSETAVSGMSLQEKRLSFQLPGELCSPYHEEFPSEMLTLEHDAKLNTTPAPPMVQVRRDHYCDCRGDSLIDQQFYCECILGPGQDVETFADLDSLQDLGHPSLTWPRVVRTNTRGTVDSVQHLDQEIMQHVSAVTAITLSPCVSEEMLMFAPNLLMTPTLKEKTESELIFEEDERRIMMELEEEKLLAVCVEETWKAVEDGCHLAGKLHSAREDIVEEPSHSMECTKGELEVKTPRMLSELANIKDCLNTKVHKTYSMRQQKDSEFDDLLDSETQYGTEDITAEFEEQDITVDSESCIYSSHQDQCSDTDSVQMFLELEKMCMDEVEENKGALMHQKPKTIVEENELILKCESNSPSLEQYSGVEPTESFGEQALLLEVSASDSAIVSDLEDCDVTQSAQFNVLSSTEAETEVDSSVSMAAEEEEVFDVAITSDCNVQEESTAKDQPTTSQLSETANTQEILEDIIAILSDCGPVDDCAFREVLVCTSPCHHLDTDKISDSKELISMPEASEQNSENNVQYPEHFTASEDLQVEDGVNEASSLPVRYKEIVANTDVKELDSTVILTSSGDTVSANEKQVDPASSGFQKAELLKLCSELDSEHFISALERQNCTDVIVTPHVVEFDANVSTDFNKTLQTALELDFEQKDHISEVSYSPTMVHVDMGPEDPLSQLLSVHVEESSAELGCGPHMVHLSKEPEKPLTEPLYTDAEDQSSEQGYTSAVHVEVEPEKPLIEPLLPCADQSAVLGCSPDMLHVTKEPDAPVTEPLCTNVDCQSSELGCAPPVVHVEVQPEKPLTEPLLPGAYQSSVLGCGPDMVHVTEEPDKPLTEPLSTNVEYQSSELGFAVTVVHVDEEPEKPLTDPLFPGADQSVVLGCGPDMLYADTEPEKPSLEPLSFFNVEDKSSELGYVPPEMKPLTELLSSNVKDNSLELRYVPPVIHGDVEPEKPLTGLLFPVTDSQSVEVGCGPDVVHAIIDPEESLILQMSNGLPNDEGLVGDAGTSENIWNTVCRAHFQHSPEVFQEDFLDIGVLQFLFEEETPSQAVIDSATTLLPSLNDVLDLSAEKDLVKPSSTDELYISSQGSLSGNESYQKERVDPIQIKLQQVNGLGQGLIQSAGKNADIQGLEHDLEDSNVRWNTLNKKVAERITQLQEALLHCGKFQDALEPLLSWLTDTEDLISNQKAPSAEYKVVKAQIQEQKLLQRLLDDRKATVEIIKAEGERIAHTAEPADKEKINKQLLSLTERWDALLGKAAARQKQLEDILVLAKEFHETMEPLADWLIGTEKKLANSEPVGTQTAKIQQQITRHKALEEDIASHAPLTDQVAHIGQALLSLTSAVDQRMLADKLHSVQAQYSEVKDWCRRKAALLEQALSNARIFGEEEVEALNWLAEVQDKLSRVFVRDYKCEVLQKQHAEQLALNEEILSRKKNMEQAVKNGQALLKQTTGEEVLIIQEKLDSIKTRHAEITATSSKALKTLEQALQLATKFQSTHEELSGWLDTVEEELSSSERLSPVGEQIPQFQQRQKELKNEVMEHRLVLDTINEVSTALLELVPWRAREGLDRLVSEANTRYKSVSDIVAQRVEQIDAAIQRSQQYEQATDAELAWVVETKRKLMALGPIRLEQDQTTAQLQVQKAFSIDIIRHKDSIDELVKTEDEILGACGEEQKTILQEKTASLLQKYEEVSLQNSERYALLERAQVLVNQFWETHEELSPWLDEILSFITRLPPPAIDPEILKQQQDEMRQLREEVAEHKPHIDKLLKIGPQLSDLNPEEAELVSSKYSTAEALYARIKDKVRQRAMALDEAVAQSTQFHDKIEPMLEALEHLADRLRSPPSIPAEMDKIREQISENKNIGMELEKLQPSFEALKHRGEELISRSQGVDKDPSAKAIQERVDQMVFFWDEIKVRAEERETKLLDVLELAEKFWYDMTALLSTIRDTQEIVRDLEEPGIDPSIIKQQMEAAEAIKEETDGLHEELEFVRILGTDLIFACGETEKPEVKKSIDEMNNAWENLNKSWKERMDKLQDAMLAAVLYQDALQGMFDWLDNAVIRLCDLSPVGTDIETVKQQINEMKEFKMDIYQQQVEMEKLNHQGDLMLKKASDDTDRDIIQEPLTELKHLWENLDEKITQRQHKLEAALLALGQFTHALAELMAWITHTEELLDAQRPISSDPKFIEIELAKHHVLKNDVLAHQVTVQTVNKAGNELLESSAGDDASNLQQCLDKLKHCWESVLQKTEEREQQLESALQMAQGFHGDVEDFFQWLSKMETQLSVSKPMGGLPETAREQLNSHMEIYNEFKSKEETYRQLLDKGRLMLLSREDASGSNTEQSLALLEQKWQSVSTKMEERKSKLEDVLNLATEFQNSLQDFINWLTQAEQTLNMAPPPSLILDTVLSQVEEHKAFLNEVNSHREHIMELDKTGNQLKFLSQKQDVVLIKNLLISMKSRWDKVVQRSFERGKALDDARKRAKQFCDAWRKLVDWLEEAESHLDSDLDISNEPDKIKLQLSKHKEFQKTLGVKQPVYDTTIRTGRSMKEKAALSDDVPKLENVLGEVRDKWDTVCGKSIERQNKLEEALLFSGQFTDALQALVDWLYKVEPQLAEDQPVHGDLDLVMNLMDAHKVFQKELGKRTGSVQALKRSARELLENSRDDTTWVKVQLQELSTRWDTVCKLSLSKQSRLEQALKQAEEFRTAVQILLEWLSEAEQTLRFRGALPDDPEALQSLIDVHKEFMKKVEEKRVDVNRAAGMGEAILAVCHPDCITTVKHWITIIRARFEEVLTWARQHQQRLELALAELISNANLLDDLLSWLQWAETTLIQQDQEPIPQAIEQVKDLISQHQSFMEEMTRKQPDVDKLTKTYKRKSSESTHATYMDKTRNRKSLNQNVPPTVPLLSQPETKNPRINQLSGRWQQVWLLALERQRKLNDALDRLEELKEFANFDFDVWRKKYMRWMNHKKSRVMDFFRRIDKDQDGKITRQEFIDGILASKFPTTKLEMTAVADIFDRDCDGYIDYYEFVAALHPNKDAYRPTTDADKIEDEVTRQVAQCKCAKRFQVEQIGENKYRFFLGNQFGDSQQLRLVRILRSTVMVRVGGGWMALDEFLVKNDPCRVHHPGSKIARSDSSTSISSPSLIARGRTNLELREKFILPEGMSQGMAPFRSRGRRSKPSSRTASPTRSSSSTSHSNHSCASMPSSPATPASGTKTPQQFTRFYDKPWLTSNKTSTPVKAMDQCHCETTPNQGSKLKRPAFHSSKGSLTGETSTFSSPPSTSAKPSRTDPKKTTSRPTSQAGSRTGSRTSSRRGSDASDFDHLETQSACSDLSETSTPGTQAGSRRGSAKPSKIPTISKKVSASPKTPTTKR